MATNFWICYQPNCGYKGPTAEFKGPNGCPKCNLEDAAFPWRKFRCLGCGFEEEQGNFFGTKIRFGKIDEAPLDEDPVKHKWDYSCRLSNNSYCDSTKYEQIDESEEGPRQKLFVMRVTYTQDQKLVFSDYDKHRTISEIRFDKVPLGTRLVLQSANDDYLGQVRAKNTRNGGGFIGDAVLLTDPQKSRKEFCGTVVSAADFDDFMELLVYLPKATSGKHQARTPDQWFDSLFKATTVEKKKKR